jgi:hypothetical protein
MEQRGVLTNEVDDSNDDEINDDVKNACPVMLSSSAPCQEKLRVDFKTRHHWIQPMHPKSVRPSNQEGKHKMHQAKRWLNLVQQSKLYIQSGNATPNKPHRYEFLNFDSTKSKHSAKKGREARGRGVDFLNPRFHKLQIEQNWTANSNLQKKGLVAKRHFLPFLFLKANIEYVLCAQPNLKSFATATMVFQGRYNVITYACLHW